jgi:site-specific DNA-methyltransferase (adenine-specific)|tara:strand:+ start:59 stop:760 length:702 start_codon:yes stop_codon:yes gene_type:complete
MIKLLQGDCLDKMKEIKDNSIDIIISSPPYEDITGAGYTSKTKDVLFLKLYIEFLDKVFKEYKRILKENGQIFFNVKSKTLDKTLKTPHWMEFTDGFQLFYFKSYIIWKYAGSFDSTKSRFHLDYEVIYHLSKGNNIHINENTGIHDPLSSVWYIPHNIPKTERLHPTQMPIALAEHILNIVGKTGDTVLDCFMGSGTTGVACKKKDINFIGIELNPKNYEIAKNRIESTNQT